MKSYLEEVKSFYNFVAMNFSHFKKRELRAKNKIEVVLPRKKIKERVKHKK